MAKAVRYPNFLAESIHESIRQKYRDTRVDTRYKKVPKVSRYTSRYTIHMHAQPTVVCKMEAQLEYIYIRTQPILGSLGAHLK